MEHATGALNMVFVHHVITNAYQNLSNVVLVIEPTDAAAAAKPALLLNAHFDNTLGSPGGNMSLSVWWTSPIEGIMKGTAVHQKEG